MLSRARTRRHRRLPVSVPVYMRTRAAVRARPITAAGSCRPNAPSRWARGSPRRSAAPPCWSAAPIRIGPACALLTGARVVEATACPRAGAAARRPRRGALARLHPSAPTLHAAPRTRRGPLRMGRARVGRRAAPHDALRAARARTRASRRQHLRRGPARLPSPACRAVGPGPRTRGRRGASRGGDCRRALRVLVAGHLRGLPVGVGSDVRATQHGKRARHARARAGRRRGGPHLRLPTRQGAVQVPLRSPRPLRPHLASAPWPGWGSADHAPSCPRSRDRARTKEERAHEG